MPEPRLTIAFLSWNRLHYLRATLESARRCIRCPGAEWIVSDNASSEPGLREYLGSCGWLDGLWVREQSHAEAMNEIVARARGEYVLIWPEDIQFTVGGGWMGRALDTLDRHPGIGSLLLNFLRRKTYRRLLGPPRAGDFIPALNELRRRGARFRFPGRIAGPEPLASFGWRLPGVVGSGIPSLTRKSTWERLGPWRAKGSGRLIDSSLGAEDDMIRRFEQSGLALQQAILMRPVAADIINDPTGSKAKVRAGKRYGTYSPPPAGDFYYHIADETSLPNHESGFPLCFEGFVSPAGFDLPLDSNGHLLKSSFNPSPVVDPKTGQPAL